jgi:hypothetical protein
MAAVSCAATMRCTNEINYVTTTLTEDMDYLILSFTGLHKKEMCSLA